MKLLPFALFLAVALTTSSVSAPAFAAGCNKSKETSTAEKCSKINGKKVCTRKRS